MTVRELIERLAAMPQDLPVWAMTDGAYVEHVEESPGPEDGSGSEGPCVVLG